MVDPIIKDGTYIDARSYGDTLGHATIQAAITAIGADDKVLVISPGTWTIAPTGTLTVPSNITLKVADGGVLDIATGDTLLIQGGFEAGLCQVFSWTGTGKVDFDVNSVGEVTPTWWGATGDGVTDDYDAIQAACDALPTAATNRGGVVRFYPGQYLFGTKISISATITFGGPTSGGFALTDRPPVVLIKASTLNDAGIQMGNHSTILENFLLDGEVGNGGDGIVNTGGGNRCFNVDVSSQGNDGFRIADDGVSNANSWILWNCRAYANGRHGLYIHSGNRRANAGTAFCFNALSNTGEGIHLGTCSHNTFIGTLAQLNGSYGIGIGGAAHNNFFYGGDLEEGNDTIGGLYDLYLDSGSNYNTILGMSVEPRRANVDGIQNQVMLQSGTGKGKTEFGEKLEVEHTTNMWPMFDFLDADVSVAADTITETAHGFATGSPIRLTTTGTVPGGLATGVTYWVIRTDANTIQLATSRANALIGTQIDITSAAGGGTHTVNEYGGIKFLFEARNRGAAGYRSSVGYMLTAGGGSGSGRGAIIMERGGAGGVGPIHVLNKGTDDGIALDWADIKATLTQTGMIQGLVTTNGPVGTCTLRANNSTTVVTNTGVTAASVIFLFPTSSNAARDVALTTGVYISSQVAATSFTITHPNNANADKTFNYLVLN